MASDDKDTNVKHEPFKRIWTAKVVRVGEHWEIMRGWIDEDTKQKMLERENRGWFIALEGSHEAIHVGFDKPNVKVGQTMQVTMEVV